MNSDIGRDISVGQLTVQQLAGFFIEGMWKKWKVKLRLEVIIDRKLN